MDNYRININYAKALQILAEDCGKEQAIAEDMRFVGKVCRENRELNVVFNNPVIKETKKVGIVEELFGKDVCEETMAFLRFVVKKKRTVSLKGISEAYLELYREKHGIVLSHLTTAIEASEETKTAVSEIVKKHTGREVELDTKVDKKIIGGMVVEFNNNMYDGSISTMLADMRREFKKNLYESEL